MQTVADTDIFLHNLPASNFNIAFFTAIYINSTEDFSQPHIKQQKYNIMNTKQIHKLKFEGGIYTLLTLLDATRNTSEKAQGI